jgi:hypothetical protein
MADTLIKSTTRHIRLFTARVEDGQLVADASQLTMDVDPDNEFLWDGPVLEKLQQRFRDLVASQPAPTSPITPCAASAPTWRARCASCCKPGSCATTPTPGC